MYIWILFPVQSKKLSLLCLCQRNCFLVVSKLSEDVKTSHGEICLQNLLCVTLPLLWEYPSHSDRSAQSAAGQFIWCSCEYRRYNQLLIHERSRVPAVIPCLCLPTPCWSCIHVPSETGDLALACHCHPHHWVPSAALPGEVLGQVLAVMACPATLGSPKPSCASTFASLTCKPI